MTHSNGGGLIVVVLVARLLRLGSSNLRSRYR